MWIHILNILLMILTHHLSILSKQNTQNSCTNAYISVGLGVGVGVGLVLGVGVGVGVGVGLDVGVGNVVGVDLGLWVGRVVGVSIFVDEYEYIKKKDQHHHTKILTCC